MGWLKLPKMAEKSRNALLPMVAAGGASFGPISHGSQMVKMTQLGSISFGELL